MTGPQFPNNEPWGRRGKVTQPEDIPAATIPWTLQVSQLDPDPPVADGFTIEVPPGEMWELVALGFSLETDSNAGNRIVNLRHVAAGQVAMQSGCPTPQAASTLRRYLWMAGFPVINSAVGDGLEFQLPMPPKVWMVPGDSLQVFIGGGLKAGDQITRVIAVYRVYKDTAKSSIL